MNKRLAGTLAAAACFAVAPLAAKQINNFFDDGFPQLIPAVQQLERTENGFTLPREVRISAPAGAEREAKLIAAIIHSRFGAYRGTVVPEGQPAQCRLILAAEGVPGSPEGYVLTIGPGGIEIRAREVRGLFYGAQTLGNLIRNNVITTLPGCRITDWPDLGVRGVFLNIRFLKDREVKGFCAALRGLAALKYNTLVLEFAENLPLKNNPFTRHHSPLSEAALKTIMDTARECHMEIIPHLQVLSHDTWMRMHPEYKTKITARNPALTTTRDWSSSACPEKPLTRELTDYTINETIRLLRPKRFHLAMDEMMLCEWNKCNLCPNGHNLDQLVREIKHYTRLVADQGVEPWMYHDTLCGKDPSGGEAALPFLPKNTVINMWSYRANPTVEYFDFFRKRGFRTTGVSYVMTLENLRAIPLACKEYRNLGSIVTYWGYLRDNFLKSIGIDACAAAGTVLAAEYQWKCSPREVHQWSYDPAWELRRRLGRAPLRRPGSSYAALPIANACTVKLGADANFPRLDSRETAKLARELAMTPEKFQLNLTTDGKIAAAVLSGGKDGYPATQVVFPVNGYCRGVTMLLTASRPSNYRKLLGKDMR
ncbi:MAG: beta-N-acetylhexosaminidase, partial [Lentisphaeria bacterium]|nr:beta-N-acetylhexosaminidase [Lentisphaeria bacterium]